MAHTPPNSADGRALLLRTLVWFLPLAALVMGATTLYIQGTKQRDIALRSRDQSSAVLIGKETLSHDVQDLVRDLHFLQREFDENDLCNEPEAFQIRDFQSSALNFYMAKQDYDQVRWIGRNGTEKLRLNANGGHPAFVPDDKLQDKKARYYFSDTLALSPGEIYISPLDLNVEHGKIALPYKPTLRVGAPVTGVDGHKCGIIVLNVLGKHILGDFVRATSPFNKRMMLLDAHGYYLQSAHPKDEWGFMFGRQDMTMAHRFPYAWQRISNDEHGQFMDGGDLWTFETVHLASDAKAAGANAPEDLRQQWKVVSHLGQDELLASYYVKRNRAWMATAGILSLLLLLSWRLARTSLARERLEQKIARQAREYEDLFNFAPFGYHSIDRNGRIIRINQTELDWLGYSRDELIGQHFTIMHANPDETILETRLSELRDRSHVQNMEFTARRKDGTTFPVSLNASPVCDDQGRFLFSRSMLFDLRHRAMLESKLKQEARSDPLTGLHNRRSFSEMANYELSRCRSTGSPACLMLFDIDAFKAINDRYGHDTGDLVLKSCAHTSTEALRSIDVLARWGGEEFIVLLPGIDGKQAAEVAERLRRAIADTHAAGPDGQSIPYTVSIGVTDLLGDTDSIETMARRADQALYAAKQDGRNCVRRA